MCCKETLLCCLTAVLVDLTSNYRYALFLLFQEDKYTALHLAVEQEDLTSLHMVEFIATNR